ncbi:MAG TPA: aminopeptidase [candidate division WOR-3 bacterium]|uniref:Aminopeptidase n=1 Tax=candidate division WOR-3 bacterium TaxID=2052148 RepID=A0A7V0T7L8_UNCW3|nr:aminopeptidase [candidate division WOR-3 bacterium]
MQGAAGIALRHASEAQLRFISPATRLEFERADCLLSFWGGWNTREMSGVNPKRMALVQVSRKPLFDTMLKRIASGSLRWCGTQYPTHAAAQDAEMSLEDYEDFVFRAGLLHKKDPVAEWHKVSARQARTAKFLGTLKTIRIEGPDTDITFNVAGRKWINCDGHENFPDGEIFTGPVENSAEGRIRYSFPAVHAGREVTGIRLTFRKGLVVEAKADKNEAYLHAMLDTDKGARRVGELAFGTNYGITRFTRNTLFDEKIGGTMHIAVGASLPESGGRNKSALHWDMVCDTRKGFTVYGDGRPIHRNGRFLKP